MAQGRRLLAPAGQRQVTDERYPRNMYLTLTMTIKEDPVSGRFGSCSLLACGICLFRSLDLLLLVLLRSQD